MGVWCFQVLVLWLIWLWRPMLKFGHMVSFFLGASLGVKLLPHKLTHVFKFLRNCWTIFQSSCMILHHPSHIYFTFTFHFHALEKEMATHSSTLAWRIPGTEEPSGLPSMGSHRVGHDWTNLAAAAAVMPLAIFFIFFGCFRVLRTWNREALSRHF